MTMTWTGAPEYQYEYEPEPGYEPDPEPQPESLVRRRAGAVLELRRRQQREALSARYDWFGDECPCGLPLGECREHPRARLAQRPPGSYRASATRQDWRVWLICAGRGFGKTFCATKYVQKRAEAGTVKWIALVSETVKDVRDVLIEHPDSGLLSDAVSPPWFKPVYQPSLARVTWPNGVFATIYSAEAPDALRGPQFDLAICDELGKWKQGQEDTWKNLEMCLRQRTVPRTQVIIPTTPRDTPTFRAVLESPRTVVTTGSTIENAAHLDPDTIRDLYEQYEGTRWGDQELRGILRLDNPGALWTHDLLDAARLDAIPPFVTLQRIVVGVDPNAGSNDPETAVETGIVVAGRGSDGLLYVLEDASTKGGPEDWARAVLRAYARWRADRIVVERNHGGDMVAHTIRTVKRGDDHPSGENVPLSVVWATRGSELRAEPVVALYEQGKVRHIGPAARFETLQRQMRRFLPGVPKKRQPDRIDRLDALVWAATELMLGSAGPSGRVLTGGSRQGYIHVIRGRPA